MGRGARADTIVAIATPAGSGGVGVVRLSGADLSAICTALLGRVPAARHATRARFRSADGTAIDDGIAIFFPRPHSYTGEDVLELQGHGGPTVLQMLVRRALELGARLAEPGEFTERAFLNDKLDLAQAEAVADLIEASTEAAARLALRSLEGEFSRTIGTLADALTELRMLTEATLDFPEEEVDPLDRAAARDQLARVRAGVQAALAGGRQGSLLRSGMQVVLAGQPNVGKSSLLNRLAGEDLAIVTPLPGTTRDVVRQTIQLGGVPISIIDTAGLRATTDAIETIGIERTWRAIERADLLVLVVDARVGVTAADKDIVARLPAALPRLVVHNKIDLTDRAPAIVDRDVYLSAQTGAGLDLLERALLDAAGWRPAGEQLYLARERHLVALESAARHLEAAASQFDRTELFAEELRLAHRELGAITGEFTADDLLGAIFTRFCIGK